MFVLDLHYNCVTCLLRLYEVVRDIMYIINLINVNYTNHICSLFPSSLHCYVVYDYHRKNSPLHTIFKVEHKKKTRKRKLYIYGACLQHRHRHLSLDLCFDAGIKLIENGCFTSEKTEM